MLNNFIYAKLKSLFEEKLAANEVPQEAIAFIEDTKEIWNHGTYFATQLSIDEIENIVASSETVQAVMEQVVLDTLDSLPVSIVSDGDGNKFLSDDGSYKVVESKFIKFSSNNQLKFYCIEPVTITLNGEDTIYPANSSVSVTLMDSDEWTITPTSDNSITLLESWPGTLGTFYSWLEGVQVFSSIVFDMNDLAMYEKWNQGHQGEYHVQFAQYNDCIFWSDNAYVNAVAERTNYTLYYSSQLPLCYSSIPENTFKAFYMAYNVTSDPNWSNPLYKESFAQATWATQVFSYYGLHSIGMFDMDSPDFNITLPKDCRGLMFYAPNVLNAGVFDAINVTNFGAMSGSWRDAFAYCYCLENLNIKNLKVNLNVSWSPISQVSLNFILSNAANTSAITIYLSPVTYYALTDDNKNIAAEKNITLSLIDTNWDEDKRTKAIQLAGDGSKFLADDGSYKEIVVPTKVSDLEDDLSIVESIEDAKEVFIVTSDMFEQTATTGVEESVSTATITFTDEGLSDFTEAVRSNKIIGIDRTVLNLGENVATPFATTGAYGNYVFSTYVGSIGVDAYLLSFEILNTTTTNIDRYDVTISPDGVISFMRDMLADGHFIIDETMFTAGITDEPITSFELTDEYKDVLTRAILLNKVIGITNLVLYYLIESIVTSSVNTRALWNPGFSIININYHAGSDFIGHVYYGDYGILLKITCIDGVITVEKETMLLGSGEGTKFLADDGEYKTIDLATTTTSGLMSAEDKTKLDQITSSNTSIVTQAEYDALVAAGATTSGSIYYIRG